MPLFQKSVLNKYLKEQDKTAAEEAYEIYYNYFHNPEIQRNIYASKEEQFQEGFLRELFVNVFGFVSNPQPNFNLTTELKNEKGAKKADGAVLKDGKAIAVIELKSTKIKDLESIRQQAFDYKANQSECVYVITSNFQKLRFYVNNAVEFEEFDLFALSKERFEVLYLCLGSQNLLADLALKIKNASLLEEENITKKFYADYSLFKKELFEDIAARNIGLENVSKLQLYKKTQKLLDRFLFIFFAEDRGLLPPNSISRMIKRWNVLNDEDAYKPLYEIYKQYFGYLNTGRAGKVIADDIQAYNGGLFLTDELLDKIEIDDAVLLKHTSTLTNYDFDSQVDVNILGHIFEHSLNEIETTTAKLEGVDFDKQKSKRKKDGVFYTPKYITKYIVDNTVGKLCEKKKTELGIKDDEFAPNRKKETKKKLLASLEAYRKWLLELTICDPACGSGAFLNQALEYLINEHHFIDGLNAQLFGSTMVFQDVENQILENNIFGVDINEESVDIARLSLWLRTAQRGRKLTTLNKNIKCGNSLIDDPEVAGDKAFNWEKEFPEVFAKGGFDVVIGNPPYGVIHDKQHKDYYKLKFESFQGNLENYCFFIEQFIRLTKLNNGKAGFIVPVTWLTIPQFEQLRKLVLKYRIEKFVELPTKIFSDADLDTLICILSKENNTTNNVVSVSKVENADNSSFDVAVYNPLRIEQKFWIVDDTLKIDLDFNPKKNDLLNIIREYTDKLNKHFSVSQGIVPYAREELYKSMEKTIADDIVDNRRWHSDIQENEFFKPELKGEDVTRYRVKWNKRQWVKYGNWLARPRIPEYFNSDRLLLREITRGSRLNGGYTKEESYNNPGLINIISKDIENKEKLLKSLLPILNSKLLFFYHLSTSPKAKLKTSIPKILINDVENLPIPRKERLTDSNLHTLCNKMIELTSGFIDDTDKFITYLHSQFSIEKLSKKLQDWHRLEFGDFIKEINKAIKKDSGEKLSKMDEMEWMEVFETKKAETQTLKAEINKTDKEIDQMVYELYGLTEEEIGIVEGSLK